tara:strand:- start:651 stop:887 length:237 start_codon:yes stop_codon:yes gene_type:complete
MDIDAVITNLEIQLESMYNPYGHFICLRFIDTKPLFPRVRNTLEEVKKHEDIYVINHKYTFEEINEKTDMSYLEITRH